MRRRIFFGDHECCIGSFALRPGSSRRENAIPLSRLPFGVFAQPRSQAAVKAQVQGNPLLPWTELLLKGNAMSTVVKAAAVHICPVLYSRQGTVEKIVKKIRDLGELGVQFATFPETVVPYYPYFSFIQAPIQNIVAPEQRKLLEEAVTVPSPATDLIGSAAKRAGTVVSIGANERDSGTL
jgi:hypothetical protein